ncbi:MAG: [protein-PII] uridylyltransferase [endosymbiont of Seepiophila jonesi]|uniref:Bifunctional uridylyltransferase/uridylyl-removing enzyme n=1 Tax=endosymbiont of Lamellibrachia luymesi TaxID=2200907 RepID=A0A370E079_9GAMM|nr:MAG: [protein-PII] uridylyltransferase [endosymbiont of Seepiophila jonesi]RDH92545.1 MAG: [protein-PII] uridylyltransferase [endosymbiont of Lamellibrachia luymesi]
MPAIDSMSDFSELDQALAGTSSTPIPIFRDFLKLGTETIREGFNQEKPIAELVAARSHLVDAVLERAWNLHFQDSTDAALVAVGGYGRGELHPASDIDLQILLDHENHFEQLQEPLGQFLSLLWDIGLEAGHSVRTIEDCIREASNDITVATNLMESRLLVGPETLFKTMREATSPAKIWDSKRFFEAKFAEQQARHQKFEDSESNLEPNLKESPGGLRDIQMIGWVVKRHFQADTLRDLVSHGFFSEDEYQTLIEGQDYLWRVRFALHTLTGRRGDILLFDYQRALANQFGYDDNTGNLAVEQFMQLFYRTTLELNRLNEILLQHFQEAILLENKLDDPVSHGNRFQSRNSFLEVTRPDVFSRTPTALLELFLILQENPELKGVRASTIRLLRDNIQLINSEFRADIRAQSLFMEILRQPWGITRELRRMNRYGILAAYIPAFENIVGRMQYDLFHVYTVDEHTLMVLRNLRRLSVPELTEETPFCTQLFRTLPKKELIYLAALFHDIAKGRGGNHSILGEKDAVDFCRLHHLSEYDSHLVGWLVRNHLVMSMTAQRKDINDPDVIQTFAENAGDTMHLDYLYLLTVADSQATNPKRWNSWKESLLRDLYKSTRRALQRGLDNPLAQEELIRETKYETLELLAKAGHDEREILRLWQSFSPEYFLSHSPNSICRQIQAIITTPPEDLPLVATHETAEHGGSDVLYYGPDRDNLFAVMTTLLDQLGLSIVNSRIMSTTQGFSLDSFLIMEEDGSPVQPGHRAEEIITTLKAGLTQKDDRPLKVHRRMPRQHKSFDTPTRIFFSQDPAYNRTVMRLIALDRPGLLSEVGQAFAACDIRLQHAKIATVGAEVEDIFFITDRENRPLLEKHQLKSLEAAVTTRLPE